MAGMEGQIDLADIESMVDYYVLALYHVVMVMLTIDMMYRPENSLERLFTVTFGGIGTGLLVYGTTVIVQQAMAKMETEWHANSKLDSVNEMVMKHQLQMGTGAKLSDFIAYSEHRLIPHNVLTFLAELPRKLKEEALLDLYEPVLACRKFFPRMSPRIVGSVLFYMEPRCFGPGEPVLVAGKPAVGLFLVCNGLLHSGPLEGAADQHEENDSVSRMGDVVGEAALINLDGDAVIQQETVLAVGLADVHFLSRANIEQLRSDLPDDLAAIWTTAVAQMALLAKVKYVVQEGSASLAAHAATDSNIASQKCAPAKDCSLHSSAAGQPSTSSQMKVSITRQPKRMSSDLSSPSEIRSLLEQLREELEGEKIKLEEERARVSDLEDELGWSQARVQELEEELSQTNNQEMSMSFNQVFSAIP